MWVGKLEAILLVIMLRTKNRAPTVCQAFTSGNSSSSQGSEGRWYNIKTEAQKCLLLARNHTASRSWDLDFAPDTMLLNYA